MNKVGIKMMGRVTQSMMNTQLLRNLNTNLTNMNHLQDQMATGRKINRPSDDPVGLNFAMRYRSDLAANDQYEDNVSSAISWLDFTDTMLDQTGAVMHRARELAVQGANGGNSETSLNAISDEIEQLYNQLVTIANSDFNGKKVFNGQMTDTSPYTAITAMNDSTDEGDILFEIGVGIKLPVNVTGTKVFGKPGEQDNTFKVLDDLMNGLRNGDYAVVNDALGRMDSRMDTMLEVRSDIGAKMNRVQLAEGRLRDISINLQTLQSKTEDADMAELITNLKTGENVYQASLSVGAKIIRPSLVDFLR